MSAGLERTVSSDDAICHIRRFADVGGFQLSHRSVGSRILTTTCDIYGPKAGMFAVGRGKGQGSQSVASALFEAFEHHFHKYENKLSKLFPNGIDLEDEKDLFEASPDFALIFRSTRIPLSCFQFESLTAGTPILFPAILTDPAYVPNSVDEAALIDRTGIYRYATNSGTAAGLTLDEGLLHGLLEAIERDAIGIAFIEHVLSPSPCPARIIDPETLPFAVQCIYQDATIETGGTLRLWNITSDIGIPAVLCAATVGTSADFRFFGSGASLDSAYAVERAILEAVQGYHVQFDLQVSLQRSVRRRTESMSLYQRCGLSAGYFAYRGGDIVTSFLELPSMRRGSLRDQIEVVLMRLSRQAMKGYYRVIFDGAVVVVQVVVPKLERLYLLSHGIPIAPSARGRRARERTIARHFHNTPS